MVILQWAASKPDANRQHATVEALTSGRLRLAMSPELFTEARDVLQRPEIRVRLPSLTTIRVAEILKKTLEFSDWFDHVPRRFSLSSHDKDDHLFDLAIVSQASFFVTWESRLLKLQKSDGRDGRRLRSLAPSLSIINPKDLAAILRAEPPAP